MLLRFLSTVDAPSRSQQSWDVSFLLYASATKVKRHSEQCGLHNIEPYTKHIPWAIDQLVNLRHGMHHDAMLAFDVQS